METDIFDKLARVIHEEISKLKPLEKQEDITSFNYLRNVSTKLCDTFDGRTGFAEFNYQRFLSIAMTGGLE